MPFLFQLLTISVLSTVMMSCPFIENVFSRYSIHISKMLFTNAQCITFVVWADNWSGMFFFYMGRISLKLHQLKGLFKRIINISICRKSIKKTNHPLPVKPSTAPVPMPWGPRLVYIYLSCYSASTWPLHQSLASASQAVHTSITSEIRDWLQPSHVCTACDCCRKVNKDQRGPLDHRHWI